MLSRIFKRPVTLRATIEGMTMTQPNTGDQLDQLTDVLGDLAVVLDRITDDQLDAPTPCSEYTVRDLRQHVVGWLTAFTDGFVADDGECSDAQAVVVEGNGAAQVRACADRLRSAIREDGALERPLKIFGEGLPGDIALGMILAEYQVHGWDLAQATGQDWQPAPEALAGSHEFMGGMLTPEAQGKGKSFGPRVDAGANASPLDRLVALTGRDPAWQATAAAR